MFIVCYTTTKQPKQMKYGYIYVRTHSAYDVEGACKMGKTDNIPERDGTYVTGEIRRGQFELVIETLYELVDNLEKDLQKYFDGLGLHVKYDGGKEFYKYAIINMIVPYMEKTDIVFRVLSKDEIGLLTRTNRIKTATTSRYIQRPDQIDIVKKSVDHFKTNDKGVLILTCGLGKTLISLWVAKELNAKKICIGVPNILLLKQWREVVCELFPDTPVCLVYGSTDISIFTQKKNTSFIVITTYASSHKVTDIKFDFKIQDEVHHLTSHNLKASNESRTYIKMLQIQSDKQISLTATIKHLDNSSGDENIVSNDNEEQFGAIIDRKCLLWAIEHNIVCDYIIQTITTNEEQLEQQFIRFNIREVNEQRLFLSAYASLKSVFDGNSHHLLIYSNNMNNSKKLIQFIKILLQDEYFDIPDLYYSDYHSEMKPKYQKEIINNFEKAKFGIITCVYCLGEGYDNHNIDAVVFAENMSSNIRIVQSVLRANRKNKLQPNKITKIILPILNKDDWLENNNNPDLKKIREVIYQMGLEDETITQKIKAFRLDIEKSKPKPKDKKEEEMEMIDEFGEYDDELTQKLRLKTTKRTTLITTYEKTRKIIADKNIKSKESYDELCENDNRLSKEPEIVFKGQFTNWIEYLSIERVYYDLETCKNKVGEYLLLYPEIKKHHLEISIICNELCKIDVLLPPNGLWVEYYNVKDLRDIITITNKKKKNVVL